MVSAGSARRCNVECKTKVLRPTSNKSTATSVAASTPVHRILVFMLLQWLRPISRNPRLATDDTRRLLLSQNPVWHSKFLPQKALSSLSVICQKNTDRLAESSANRQWGITVSFTASFFFSFFEFHSTHIWAISVVKTVNVSQFHPILPSSFEEITWPLRPINALQFADLWFGTPEEKSWEQVFLLSTSAKTYTLEYMPRDDNNMPPSYPCPSNWLYTLASVALIISTHWFGVSLHLCLDPVPKPFIVLVPELPGSEKNNSCWNLTHTQEQKKRPPAQSSKWSYHCN